MMSLDVYLTRPNKGRICSCCGKEYQCNEGDELFWKNITHNLNTMAEKANIYKELWRPEEIGITKAKQLIKPLEAALLRLESDESYFRQYNPSNGWGSYDGLVEFITDYLEACRNYPEADVYASR